MVGRTLSLRARSGFSQPIVTNMTTLATTLENVHKLRRWGSEGHAYTVTAAGLSPRVFTVPAKPKTRHKCCFQGRGSSGAGLRPGHRLVTPPSATSDPGPPGQKGVTSFNDVLSRGLGG